MKTKFAIVGGLAAAALAGCTISAPPAPTVTVTAPPETVAPAPAPETVDPAPLPPEPSKEEWFVQTLEDELGPLTYSEERQLIKFAKATCRNFRDFGVETTLREYLYVIKSKKEVKIMGFVIGAGTAIFCPRYTDYLTNSVSV